jgi:hypothetical protein
VDSTAFDDQVLARVRAEQTLPAPWWQWRSLFAPACAAGVSMLFFLVIIDCPKISLPAVPVSTPTNVVTVADLDKMIDQSDFRTAPVFCALGPLGDIAPAQRGNPAPARLSPPIRRSVSLNETYIA